MVMGNNRSAGWLGSAVGVVLLFSVASLAVFFAIGGPFGALNDWSIGLGGILAGLLALAVGFALIGAWLIVLNRSSESTSARPRGLRTLGLVAGILMAIGIIAAPGVAMGLDDIDSAPGWVWIAFIGWLGIFFLYPIWGIWLGRVTRQV